MLNKSPDTPPRKEAPCAICGKVAQAATRPFCSTRCQDIDLNRWLSGSYAIPVSPSAEEDQE